MPLVDAAGDIGVAPGAEDWGGPRVGVYAGEIVVMAKAEALEICGENRDSVVLIRKHLAGISAAD